MILCKIRFYLLQFYYLLLSAVGVEKVFTEAKAVGFDAF